MPSRHPSQLLTALLACVVAAPFGLAATAEKNDKSVRSTKTTSQTTTAPKQTTPPAARMPKVPTQSKERQALMPRWTPSSTHWQPHQPLSALKAEDETKTPNPWLKKPSLLQHTVPQDTLSRNMLQPQSPQLPQTGLVPEPDQPYSGSIPMGGYRGAEEEGPLQVPTGLSRGLQEQPKPSPGAYGWQRGYGTPTKARSMINMRQLPSVSSGAEYDLYGTRSGQYFPGYLNRDGTVDRYNTRTGSYLYGFRNRQGSQDLFDSRTGSWFYGFRNRDGSIDYLGPNGQWIWSTGRGRALP